MSKYSRELTQKLRDHGASREYVELDDHDEFSPSNFLDFFKNYNKDTEEAIEEGKEISQAEEDMLQMPLQSLQEEAKTYVTALDQVKDSYSIDEFLFKEDMSTWSPKVSQILRAHDMGMSLDQFNLYMRDTAQGYHGTIAFKPQGSDESVRMSETDFRRMYGADDYKYTPEQVKTMYEKDYAQLQSDLVQAGMDKDMYDRDFQLKAARTTVQSALQQRASVEKLSSS